MKVDIQISDSNAAGASAAGSNEISPSTPTSEAANARDGGAPNLTKEGSSGEVSAGDTTDIGGPPRSLLESLGTERKQSDSPAVSAAEESGQKQDGGAAPGL